MTVISRWLARHLSDEELLRELEPSGHGALTADQTSAVEELRAELAAGRGGAELDMVAHETPPELTLG